MGSRERKAEGEGQRTKAFVICHLSSVIFYSLFWNLLFAICYLLFAICYLVFGIWYLQFAIWYVFAIWYFSLFLFVI